VAAVAAVDARRSMSTPAADSRPAWSADSTTVVSGARAGAVPAGASSCTSTSWKSTPSVRSAPSAAASSRTV
jgi:hypothetical protein